MKNKTLKRVRLLQIAWAAAGVFVLTCLPILYCSWFDYATGDDLNYGSVLHRMMLENPSVSTFFSTLWTRIKALYFYQGTWSSLLLFQLQPGIWGEHWYRLTPWIALLCFLVGTGYLLYELLVRQWKLGKDHYMIVFFACSFLSIQYMPKIRGGVFWYTSVAHYLIPYLFALLAIAWIMRFLTTGKKRYYVFALLAMIYLGGAGYPTIVMTEAAYFLMALFLIGKQKMQAADKSRSTQEYKEMDHESPASGMPGWKWLIWPMSAEMAGFVVSAVSPGNGIRGGEEFGLSSGNALHTILTAFYELIPATSEYCGRCILIIFGWLLVVMVTWAALKGQKKEASPDEPSERRFRHPLLFSLAMIVLAASVRMPRIYANVAVSGGVPDTEFFVYVLASILMFIYLTGAVFTRVVRAKDKEQKQNADSAAGSQPSIALRALLLLMAVLLAAAWRFRSPLMRNSAAFICIDFVASGRAADYVDQMEERIAILEDERFREIYLPEMNEDQGPFMHMPLTQDDPDAFTNNATRMFYNKDFVLAVPRDEFYEKYAQLYE